MITRVMLNTLIHNQPVYKGSQCVLFVGSVVYGPLQAHVYRQDESKGVMENPLYAPKICLHYGIVQFENSTHSSVDP